MTAVETFAADYFVRNQISTARRRTTLRQLRDLEAFTGVPAEDTTAEQFGDWMTSRVAGGMNPNSVTTYVRAVRPFLRWAWERDLIADDRWMRLREVKSPRGTPHVPRPYSRQELDHFYTLLERQWRLLPDERLGYYMRRIDRGTSRYARVWKHAMRLQIEAIIALMLHAGLRHSETLHASMLDIHPDNEFVVVRRGKGGKVREVPFTESCRTAVEQWLEFRARLDPSHDRPWLCLSPNATPNHPLLPSHPLNQIGMRRFAELPSTMGDGWEYHRFRHTCGTNWLRAGVPLEVVSRLLGHSNITTTLGYAELVRDDLTRHVQRREADFLKLVGRREINVNNAPRRERSTR